MPMDEGVISSADRTHGLQLIIILMLYWFREKCVQIIQEKPLYISFSFLREKIT